MPLTIATATASFRKNTEDRLAVHHVEGGLVVVVADGAGGIPGGGAAADVAIKTLAEAVEHAAVHVFDAERFGELLVHVDAIIESDLVAGETTCVIVAITEEGRIVGASCGDSGALLVAPDETVDDLTAMQKRKRRLGGGTALPVTFERPVFEGTLVVGSDGLFNYARNTGIAEVVLKNEDLDETALALLTAVRLPSGDLQDDVAIVLVRSAP